MELMEHAFAKVCEVFGIESLNKHQEDAIKYVVEEKKDVFVNLPTGFGKSLIYQALPLVYSCLQSTFEKNITLCLDTRQPGTVFKKLDTRQSEILTSFLEIACLIPLRT